MKVLVSSFFLKIVHLKLLYYNAFDSKGLSKQIKKVETALKKGDFHSADVKKMVGTDGFYRAKLDKASRLLFKFAKHDGETYILLLEVIKDHEYDKARFLRGADINPSNFIPVPVQDDAEEGEDLVYINPKRNTFHILDKILSFDEDQHEIYGLPAPLIIIGSAGSGKTALTLEKMKHFNGQVAYLSLSPYLVENAQRIYYANDFNNPKQEIEFLSFEEYLQGIEIPGGKEITFRAFEGFYSRFRQTFKFKEPYKLYEEFKGVLTGSVIDKPYLSKTDYIDLGVKQSIFLKNEREKVYDLFERYLAFLKEANFYDPNIIAYQYLERVQPRFDFLVIDEVQDITNIQLILILKSLIDPTHFLLSGDSNQIVHPNFFSWSKIKTLFFEKDLKGSVIRILKTNYRNSQKVTKLSNDLLKIKHARFGSIDKESTYLINTVSATEGEISFYKDNEQIKKKLNKQTRNSTKFAILVMDKKDKQAVRSFFDTPLVFTIQEAKGLEYENIILVNFISSYEKEFREITKGVTQEDVQSETLQYARAKNKENKELEAYKFYINSLYVAFTRAVKNLYIIEKQIKFDILALLGIVKEQQKITIQQSDSSEEEWLEEARRLEKQGKHEQAQEIRDRLRGVEYISQEQANILIEQIFSSESPEYDTCQKLFNFAKNRQQIHLIERLFKEVQFGPAKHYMEEYAKAQKDLAKQIRNNNLKHIERYTNKFGIDMREYEAGRTGLMLAILYGKSEMVKFFISKEANLNLHDAQSQNLIQMVLLAYELEHINDTQLKSWYHRFAQPAIKVQYNNQVRKIGIRSMEYFLVNYIMAVRNEIIPPDDPPALQGLQMDDFMDYIELMPNSILPPYRKKRQYVNSILAKNEIDRDDPYNKFLFRRKSRGCYNLLEGLKILEG